MVAKATGAYRVERGAVYTYRDEMASPRKGQTRERKTRVVNSFDLDGELLDGFDIEEEEEFGAEEEQRGRSGTGTIDDSVKQYLKEIGSYPLLTAEQELQLAERVSHGD